MDNKKYLLAAGVVAVLIIAGAAIFYAGPKDSDQNGLDQISQTVTLRAKENIGAYMADGRGMTLYYFPKDTIGKSNCFGECLAAWPIFYDNTLNVSTELAKTDFSEITRTDGVKQTTYKGWPLYYYFRDLRPGDTLGEGVGNVWYVVPHPFYTVMSANLDTTGNYLADPNGMALYYFTVDRRGTSTTTPQSNCSSDCLINWPKFHAENVIAPSLMAQGDFSEITRADNAKQTTYKGWPLYYYINDVNPGDINGEGINNVWFLAKP